MRSRAVITGVLLGTALVSGGWWMQRGLHAPPADAVAGAQLFDQVVGVIERNYVEPVADSALYRHAVDGLLRELHDPHSVYLAGDRLARLEETTTGRYGGIGVQLDVRDGWIVVVSPIPGTPADQAGIETGDRIVEIEGASTKGWTSEEALKALRGEPGSTVRIAVERPAVTARIPFTLTRKQIQFHAVRHPMMLRDGIGYVDLTSFSESAAKDVRAAVDSLWKSGMRTLVFDLRGDPGGLLDQGVEVADLFLNSGQRIVSMRGRTPDANRDYTDGAPQQWPQLRMLVLVDSGTASASEIVAGALQDHDRAVLLGTDTYGKGSAQTVFSIGGRGALKLTTALWFTPSGRSISRTLGTADTDDDAARVAPEVKPAEPTYRTDSGRTVHGGGGITPDIIVPDPIPTRAERALERALGSDLTTFRDVLASYALSLKGSDAVQRPDFAVTPEMRAELHRRLAARGVSVDSAVFAGATPLIDRWIGSQVTRFVFGERAQFERVTRQDPTVLAALRLATEPGGQKDLLEKARAKSK